MKERLTQLFEKQRIKNANEFAKMLGYSSPEKINRLFRDEKAMPSVEILIDIANKFANLNLRWLLTGQGSMMIDDLPDSNSKGEVDILRQKIIGLQEQLIEKLNYISEIEAELKNNDRGNASKKDVKRAS